MYNPFIFKLESGNSETLERSETDNLITSSTINLPLSSLGFHTFFHRTKSAMSITNNLQTKNKFYYVVNPFEEEIANYEDSLNNLTKHYLNIKDDRPEILSRSFYKMWEMLYLFNLVEKKEITYAALAEGPGPFIQAVILFREKLGSGISNDKIFGVTVHSEKGKYLEMGKQFLGFYNENVPGLINLHTTIDPAKSKKYKAKSTGDITDIKTISLFKKDIEKSKQYADLVTADGEFEWDDTNYQEQEGYKLILGEIIAALNVQAKNGHFVLKIFESFTLPTIKLLYILSSFYNETYIYKPSFSRPSESERYVICKDFKYDHKKDSAFLDKRIKSLQSVLEQMNTLRFVYDIYPDLEIPQSFLDKIKFINIKIANPQQIMINEIIKYIKENNYFGDKYHMFREKQIEATKWWINNFFPPSKNLFDKNKEDLQKIVDSTLYKYNMEQEKLAKQLIN
jgi:23S rRNA U2552 (ribose-2'-O)-methylase RlmE/FtsJ